MWSEWPIANPTPRFKQVSYTVLRSAYIGEHTRADVRCLPRNGICGNYIPGSFYTENKILVISELLYLSITNWVSELKGTHNLQYLLWYCHCNLSLTRVLESLGHKT